MYKIFPDYKIKEVYMYIIRKTTTGKQKFVK